MTVDDGTGITIACAVVAALASAVAWLWKAMDKRYQTELAKRDVVIDDLTKRIRSLEDDRIPTMAAHAAEMKHLNDRYDGTAATMAEAVTTIAKAVRELASNVNQQTTAISAIRCKSFDQALLPEAHPAGKGTDALTAKNRGHA